MKKYRLGIDLGATSLGWSILELNDDNFPIGLINLGVRIFPDGRDAKTSQPLNVTRREHRGARRNRDRYLQRRAYLMDTLIEYGLLQEDEEKRKQLQLIDPYFLRAKALDEEVTIYEIGRIIFHLNQRRGFKSNRKLDSAEKETSRLKEAIKELRQKLDAQNARTLGEYLYNMNKDIPQNEHHKKRPVRIRDFGKSYNFYTSREMYKEEFDFIWKSQVRFHDELTDDIKEHLRDIIFFQRPLQPQQKGKCRFEVDEPRCPVAYPLFQQFRIYQEANNLILLNFERKEHELTKEQRDIIIKTLLKQKTSTFKSLKKKILKEDPEDYVFNLESEKRKDLKGDETSHIMRKEECFGKQWDKLSNDQQDEIIRRIINEDNDVEIEKTMTTWLQENFGLTNEQANNIKNVRLPQGIGSLSKKAINKLLPYLKEGYIYSDACARAGYHHSDFRTGEIYDEGNLPYYGKIMPHHVSFGTNDPDDIDEIRYGKIANPTVHIALNQLRKLTNALVKKYGPPAQIVIELARELKLGKKRLDEINRDQAENRKHNEEIAEELEKISIENTYQNRLKYKLWEELNPDPIKRCCPYTGKQISINELFTNKFEIEHILPKSKTFDDRPLNKTVSYYLANKFKGERSPYEAFGNSPEDYNWDEILERGKKLPPKKRWRFFPDAMKNFEDQGELISRLLTDTQYMSRMAKEYLSYISGPNNVWAIPGALTSKFRAKWGLNELLSDDSEKNRADNRHHAIDGFIVACTDRAMLQKFARATEKSRDRFIEEMPPPYEEFSHDGMQKQVDDIVVSYKPDHGNAKEAIRHDQTVGQLHDETAYGLVSETEDKITLSVRKPIRDLTTIKKINEIADNRIRETLLNEIENNKDKKIENILEEFRQRTGTKRVKIHVEKDKKTVVPIRNDKGESYKYYLSGNNYCADIYCPDKGKDAGKWQIEIIPMFYAHQQDFEPEWHKKYPTAKKIMRLFINDNVAYEEDGIRIIRRVRKMTGKIVYLRELDVAKKEKGKEDIGEQFRPTKLQDMNARKVGIDILGNISDPRRHEYTRDQNE
ncbi:MAG: type II CRISPR RNA-guided endonuclease Cas9 [Candidatus Cloacimonetes bacterium]|nr:type II CRISPR RNA-guided endonuclease Cas9 [Candidatus Cloacimonadota bacterium]